MSKRDYFWDARPDRIILDESLDIDKLGWKGGDYFKLVNLNGQAMLVKADALQRFIESQGKDILE